MISPEMKWTGRSILEAIEELKAKLQSPQNKVEQTTRGSGATEDVRGATPQTALSGSEDTNIQKAISEFKEKLKEKIKPFKELKKIIIPDFTNPNHMRTINLFIELDKEIEKTAQEIK